MSTTVKWDMAGATVLGVDTLILTDATETNFDFGTPDDINLANVDAMARRLIPSCSPGGLLPRRRPMQLPGLSMTPPTTRAASAPRLLPSPASSMVPWSVRSPRTPW